ncbi:alpha-hydroxy acid oxidase [Salinicola rhizosphaerae]|uniref:Alpha-hydroxy-acid oxidizing enzyme n=1 Tax=Salinicola rhizosphaerae TaxID=1443141 RepID=A0ABQ3E0S0_9GAMM|nr:alpha-hydroxy acid oxidase [Salinicola rhizosphaerae]GHB22010.1 alpha-hydroxy-acid oxidizing enzyme [Salinicola rhizosphaerae]
MATRDRLSGGAMAARSEGASSSSAEGVSLAITAWERWRFARRLKDVLCLEDFERHARRLLPRSIYGYVAGAAETNASHDDNLSAFRDYAFVHRSLINVSQRTTGTTLMGREYAQPFGIAPMGVSALTAYRGDIRLASAARRAGIPMVISASGLIAMESIAAVNPDVWFQAYMPPDAEGIRALVDRVAKAGIETLVITVDSAVVPSRENNVRSGYKTPIRPDLKLIWQGATHPEWALCTLMRTIRRHGMPHFENVNAERGVALVAKNVERDFSGREHLDWDDIARIREQWKGKLVLKGILAVEDATRAEAMGIDGIVVSNHGGRQLDGDVSPLRVLPGIAAAVTIDVMIDSGFRRGSDVLKAIALGAKFVFVGRPFNYAATTAGEAGVDHAIGILATEVRRNMGMLGINALEEMTAERLYRVR